MAYDKAQSLVLRYCDTSFGWHTNRQSVVVRYDPDPEESPHVTLQSPDTVFVIDDDALGCVTNRVTACEPVAEPIMHLMEWRDNVRYVINPCVVARNGRDALFRVSVSPHDYPADRISWTCSDPGIEFVGPSTGKTVRVRATSAAAGGSSGGGRLTRLSRDVL